MCPSAPPLPTPLPELAASLDEGLYPSPEPVLVKLAAGPSGVELGLRPLTDCEHPLEVLLGFTAPESWAALGLHCRGKSYRLAPPEHSYTFDRDAAGVPAAVTMTLLLDRHGHGAGIVRDGASLTCLAQAPGGLLGDACRRALNLPTAPPPATTVDLWLRVWLDRVIDAVAFLGTDHLNDWESILNLHPVAISAHVSAGAPSGGPVALADATCRLAEAWPWHHLKQEPEVVDTRQPPLGREVTGWMDAGMYARWTLAALPSLDDLAAAVETTLPPPLTRAIADTIACCTALWD